MRHAKRGFTLVEILIVVVILGILAAIVVPQYGRAADDAARTAALDQLEKLRRALMVYYVRNNSMWPDVSEGSGTWGALIDPTYMRSAPVNPWVGGGNNQRIILRGTPDTGFQATHAWIFDPPTGQVWAGAFDGQDNPWPR